MLEVCKWLSAFDVLQAAWASSLWEKVTATPELWWELCRSAGFSVPSSEHPRDGYKRLSNSMKTLVIVRPSLVRSFSIKKLRWSEVRRMGKKLQVDEFSSAIILPDGSVLCCGGSLGAPWRTAYRLALQGEVQPISDMVIPRGGHGLAVCGKAIYAFGGCGGNSCEAIEWEPLETLSKRTWKRIPNMLSVRCYFAPLAADPLIYLCGGFTDTCEVFNCETVTYELLNVSLPECSEVCAVLGDWEIILLSPGYISRLSLRVPGSLATERHEKWSGVWGSMNAVLYGDTVYNPFDCAVQAFNLRTYEKQMIKP